MIRKQIENNRGDRKNIKRISEKIKLMFINLNKMSEGKNLKNKFKEKNQGFT